MADYLVDQLWSKHLCQPRNKNKADVSTAVIYEVPLNLMPHTPLNNHQQMAEQPASPAHKQSSQCNKRAAFKQEECQHPETQNHHLVACIIGAPGSIETHKYILQFALLHLLSELEHCTTKEEHSTPFQGVTVQKDYPEYLTASNLDPLVILHEALPGLPTL